MDVVNSHWISLVEVDFGYELLVNEYSYLGVFLIAIVLIFETMIV